MSETAYAAKPSLPDRAFNALNSVFLGIFFIAVLYPIVYVVSASFSDPSELVAGNVYLLPVNPTIEGYIATFQYKMIWSGFYNSFLYMIAGTAINLVMTVLAAYPLSRKDFVGRNLIMFAFSFTMWFTGGLIPQYLLTRDLGILYTRWAMLLPGAMSVYNMIIMRTYFQTTIPDELYNAARIDGCGNTRFLLVVALPLSGAILAVIGLFYAISHWNSYFSAFIYLSDRKLLPLQIVLREIILMNQADEMLAGFDLRDAEKRRYMGELLKYSTIVVSCLPVMAFYLLAQRFFVKGVMIGAIKG
ncbi:MAG: carbohydrate ABC transporter permease [Clostridiales bacterium]|jgi:multiple sugar transport system permease protein/putative aldouronate transport system permease protein|nr:carbohydrate ABC transporter permease [Clostridiales bacterium]